MNRLLQIEWLKLKHYRPFWVLTALYGVLVTLIGVGVHFFLIYLKHKGMDMEGIDPTILPIYDFPDVWQNISYIATFFKLFLAFIIIISVANEANFRTLRQNIIDGMSKKDWLLSKLLLIGSLALGATILLFLIGLIMGLFLSHPAGLPYIFHSTQFLLAYFLEVFTFLTFALLIVLIIRKPGIVIVGLMMYTLAFEPFLALFLMHYPDLPAFCKMIAPFLPIRALNNLIHVPFQKYVFQEIQDYVSLKETLIVLTWLGFNVWGSYRILKNRDL